MKRNIIDQMVAFVDPARGLARDRARIASDLLLRQYDAAQPSRNTEGWRRPSTSARAETGRALVTLRNSARELSRNHPNWHKAVGDLTDLTIGTGIVPRAKTGDEDLNALLNGLWTRAVRTMNAEGVGNAYGQQRLIGKAFWESGEVIARRRFRRLSDGLEVPLQYQVMEGDFLDHTQTRLLADGGRIVQGVEFSPIGARRAYHLHQDHPGDGFGLSLGGSLSTRPVPASEIRHIYEELRPGQARGIPPFTAAMLTTRALGVTDEAEDLRKRLEACITLIVTGSEVGHSVAATDATLGPMVRDADGNVLEQIEPALIAYLRGGMDVKAFQPSAMPGYVDHRRSRHQSMAAGARVMYEVMTTDLSQVNYSSYKAGMNLMWRMVEAIQYLVIIPQFCEPQWCDFVEACILAGRVPYDTPYDVEFTAPKAPTIDPVKEAMADLIEVRAGFKSLQEAIAARGYDPDTTIAEIKATAERLDSLGLILDSDARKVSRMGLMQDASKLSADRSLSEDELLAAVRQLSADPGLRERVLAGLPG